MPRVLKPCGTEAAYRRHLRNGEEACDACKAAVAGKKMDRLDGDRDTRKLSAIASAVPEPSAEVAPASSGSDEYDPLTDAKENLRLVKAALKEAVPREVSALSKRRQELVALISELGGKKEVSIADQLAERRAARRRAEPEASATS